ncbi:MAG: GDP-L-fucose synthase [Steroidobacteraceae bacterium]
MTPESSIFVAGHRGLVGSAIVRRLRSSGYHNLVLRSRSELDLKRQGAVRAFFAEVKPEYVFLAAAKVGGILANDTHPAQFLHENLAIQTNVIDSAYREGSKKLLFLGSSCIYPKHAPQPMPEDCLLTGPLEPTNEWYAIAKIAGLKMCQAYRREYGFDAICAMPTNLYGPGDNFDLKSSHVLPALIRKFHEAKANGASKVEVWGTGKPRREFLHVDDLAEACLYLMQNYSDERLVNIGWGTDVSIAELAELIANTVGYSGAVQFNTTMPDGTPRKLLDVSRATALGWTATIPLAAGIASTYKWFLGNASELRS